MASLSSHCVWVLHIPLPGSSSRQVCVVLSQEIQTLGDLLDILPSRDQVLHY
jgi:hypothetical protein